MFGFASLRYAHSTLATWIRAGSFQATSLFYHDQLSLVCCWWCMASAPHSHLLRRLHVAEAGFYPLFTYLNLFMFFMLTLFRQQLLGDVIGWEGVGRLRIY